MKKHLIYFSIVILITILYRITIYNSMILSDTYSTNDNLTTMDSGATNTIKTETLKFSGTARRNIFSPPKTLRKKITTTSVKTKEKIKLYYQVTGIIPSKTKPAAIILNTDTKQTAIAKNGDILDDNTTKIVDILKNSVIIDFKGTKKELKLKSN